MNKADQAILDQDSKSYFGFWVYLMTDVVLFASLFATYAVLQGRTFGGPSGEELFILPLVLAETIILLTSSFTIGLGVLAARHNRRREVLVWLTLTILLGLAFLGIEINEFIDLINEGNSFTNSAFLSAFFTLVGTHGLHIMVGLIWMFALTLRIARRGLQPFNIKRLLLLSLFWHFLDIIWIFIFTIVYLLGVV